MSTSGVRILTKTANDLIRAALVHIISLDSQAQISADLSQDAIDILNDLLVGGQMEGIGLWMNRIATIYLQKGVFAYDLGPTGSDYTLDSVETDLAVAGVLGDTTLTLTSNAVMTAADNIGVQLDTGYLQWTTISTILAANQVLVANSLTGTAALGNKVFSYTTKADRPFEIPKILIRDRFGIDQELTLYSRDEYLQIPNKSDRGGYPINCYYDPQLNSGILYTWPACSDVTYRLIASIRLPIQIIDNLTEDLEIPAEWYRPITWMLAAEIAPDCGVNLQTIAYLEQKAARLFERASAFDMDKGSFYFQPDLSR